MYAYLMPTSSTSNMSVELAGIMPLPMVRVHYTGWLYNFNAKDGKGRKFDSSRDRGQPLELPIGVGKVIKGWEQGVVGMKVGARRTLVIPPELGYGARNMGNGLIPPNSTLLFEVELLGVR